MSTKRSAKAFTLLELLIVIAIVGVLAALLVGVCLRAKAKAHQTSCRSNLRQLAFAMRMYLDDNSGRFPTTPGWTKNLLPHVTGQIMQCPSDPRPPGNSTNARSPSSFDAAVSDYWLNSTLMRRVTNRGQYFVVGQNESAVFTPTDTFLFGDAAGARKLDSVGQAEWPVIHSGGANYCFVDSHVKWLKPDGAAAFPQTRR